MAGIKRKESPTVKLSSINRNKKLKITTKDSRKPKEPALELETATDSDPIVESDTTEHSGDDDGESWPSDDDQVLEEITQPVPRQTSKVDAGSTNGISNCTSSLIVSVSYADIFQSYSVKGGPCKAKGCCSRAESREAECGFNSSLEEVMGTATEEITRTFGRTQRAGGGAI